MTERRTTALLAGTVLAAGLLTAGLAGPAAAAPSDFRVAGTTHCVSAMVPAGSTATPAPERCFSTFRSAILFATGGTVRLPAGATTVTQQQLDAGRASALDYEQPMLTSVVLGISYLDTGWTGTTRVHTGSYGCDTDPDVDWQNAALSGIWNDSIGSASAFSDCTGTYWALANFLGANIDTGWSSGVMNNAASSIQWY
jgi:hypothetical protein